MVTTVSSLSFGIRWFSGLSPPPAPPTPPSSSCACRLQAKAEGEGNGVTKGSGTQLNSPNSVSPPGGEGGVVESDSRKSLEEEESGCEAREIQCSRAMGIVQNLARMVRLS